MNNLKYLTQVVEIIGDLHNLTSRSSLRTKDLKDLQKIWDDPEVKMLRMCEIR